MQINNPHTNSYTLYMNKHAVHIYRTRNVHFPTKNGQHQIYPHKQKLHNRNIAHQAFSTFYTLPTLSALSSLIAVIMEVPLQFGQLALVFLTFIHSSIQDAWKICSHYVTLTFYPSVNLNRAYSLKQIEQVNKSYLHRSSVNFRSGTFLLISGCIFSCHINTLIF